MTNETKLYNSRILNVFILFLAEKYPHVSTSEIFDYAEVEYCEVIDEGSWFTQKQVDRFVEKTIQLTKNTNIAREAGRFAATPGAIGAMRQAAFGMIGPMKTFQLLNKITQNFVRSAEYLTRPLSSNRVEITVRPFPEMSEKLFQCQNRMGFFEAIISGFNLGMPQIEHPECVFEGGSSCRYIITWKQNLVGLFNAFRNIFSIATILILLSGLLIGFSKPLLVALPILFVLILLFALCGETVQRREMNRALTTMWDSSDRLAEEIASRAQNLQLIQAMGNTLTKKQSTEDVLTAVIRLMEEHLNFDCGAIILADNEKKSLKIRRAYGYSLDDYSELTGTSFNLNKVTSEGPLVQCFYQQKPILINSTRDIKEKLSEKSQTFVDRLGIDSFICCPIVVEGVSLGVIAVNNQKSRRILIKSDTTLLQGIAPVIGVALQNAELIENLQNFFEKTIKVLADSIDARDSLTAGHSEQVTHYTEKIGEELGLCEDEIATLRIASLLHDYGKIGVPDTILCKNGPLTTEERAIINTHPAQTEKILNQIPFPQHQAQIPLIAGCHHEHWDGSGYPRGLKGVEIPLGSRIIAVADFFEAITTRRHYRRPMPLDVAIQLLKKESGTHFDPSIVDCFLRIMENDSTLLASLRKQFENEGGRKADDKRPLRIPFQTQVSVQYGNKIIHGKTSDISEKGIYVITDEIVDYHASIIVTLCPPGHSEFVHIHGEIAWINNDKISVSSRHQVGFAIRFREVPGEVLKTIRLFINQYSGVASIEYRKAK